MRHLLLLPLILLLAGCDLVGGELASPPRVDAARAVQNPTLAGLQAYRQRWQQAGVEAYRFEYEVDTVCPVCELDPRYSGPFIVDVRGDRIVEWNYTGAYEAPEGYQPLTMDRLFQQIEEAFAEADVVASYEPDLGFPVRFTATGPHMTSEVTVTGFEQR